MRLIIAGSRAFAPDRLVEDPGNPGLSEEAIDRAVERYLFTAIDTALAARSVQPATGGMIAGYQPIDTVLSGVASGADRYGERWAAAHAIPVIHFPPKYDAYPPAEKRRAPLDRNTAMAAAAAPDGALIVLTVDRSSGSAHMITQARAYGLRVWHRDISRAALWTHLIALASGKLDE